MKHYLDLVPISAKIHKKQSRMSIFCIVLAVFLVTTIFGMADMFIRSILPLRISAMKKQQLLLHALILKYFHRMAYSIIVEI